MTPHGYSFPAAVTLDTFTSPFTDCTGAFMTNFMPFSSRCLWMTSAMSLSAMRGMTWSIISITVTSFPIAFRETASSRPMTPAPPTTTSDTPSRAFCMRFPSLTVLTMNTFSRSAPGTGGTKTFPPVAMTRES